jgi:hypothetical protein
MAAIHRSRRMATHHSTQTSPASWSQCVSSLTAWPPPPVWLRRRGKPMRVARCASATRCPQCLPNRCKTMSCFGAASGQSSTRSACQLRVFTISSGPARVRAVSCNICRSGHCRKGIYGTANQSIDDPFDHLTVIPKWPAPHTIEHGNNGSTTFHCASVKTASQSHQTH